MTYGERLASAMAECGFEVEGGQSKLARAIGNNSQSINQAINNGSNLRAVYHVRACIRLGIRPLWLSEGRGLRYDPAGPRAAFPGAEAPWGIPDAWRQGLEAEQGSNHRTGEHQHADLSLPEQIVINAMRGDDRVRGVLQTIVELAAVGRS